MTRPVRYLCVDCGWWASAEEMEQHQVDSAHRRAVATHARSRGRSVSGSERRRRKRQALTGRAEPPIPVSVREPRPLNPDLDARLAAVFGRRPRG